MERTRHSYVAGSPRYNQWERDGVHANTIVAWCQGEGGARTDLGEYDRAASEVRIANLDHKVNEIGAMVAQVYNSFGMTGQLPEQMKQVSNQQRRRPPVGFGQ